MIQHLSSVLSLLLTVNKRLKNQAEYVHTVDLENFVVKVIFQLRHVNKNIYAVMVNE